MLKSILKWGGLAALALAVVIALWAGFSGRSWGRYNDSQILAEATARKAAVKAEADARKAGDLANAASIDAETNRAKAAEGVATAAIVALDTRVGSAEAGLKEVQFALFAKARPAVEKDGKVARKATKGGALARLDALEEKCEGCEEAPDGDGDNNADDAKPAPGAGK